MLPSPAAAPPRRRAGLAQEPLLVQGPPRRGRGNTRSTWSNSVDRRCELENLRRSLAMLEPHAKALSREEAMALVHELQEAIGRLERMREGLRAVLEDERARPWWTPPKRS